MSFNGTTTTKNNTIAYPRSLHDALPICIDLVFKYKKTTYGFVVMMLPLCALFFTVITKSKMPELERTEAIVNIDWNENIHVDENNQRINALMMFLKDDIEDYTSLIGKQQFILNRKREQESSESEIYIKCEDIRKTEIVAEKLKKYISQNYPSGVVDIAPPANLFERIFTTGEADLDIELYKTAGKTVGVKEIKELKGDIENRCGYNFSEIPFSNQYNVCMDIPKMLIYNVSQDNIVNSMRTAFRQYNVSNLRSHTQYLPVFLGYV